MNLAAVSVGAVLAAFAAGCRSSPSATGEVSAVSEGTASQGSSTDTSAMVRAVERAEGLRRPEAVPAEALASADPSVRRAVARAFARIGGTQDAPLLRALEDEDDDTVAWAAYGLGETCKGHELRTVRGLAARLASLAGGSARRVWLAGGSARLASLAGGSATATSAGSHTLEAIEARSVEGDDAGSFRAIEAGSVAVVEARPVEAVLRALGRCGGTDAEAALVPWLRQPTPFAESAAFALGEVAGREGAIDGSLAVRLLEAAEGTPRPEAGEGIARPDAGTPPRQAGEGTSPLDAALYPFGQVDAELSPVLGLRLAAAARRALSRSGPQRIFALRALSRSGDPAAARDLALFLTLPEATLGEGLESVRALARLGKTGREALVTALTRTLLVRADVLLGPRFPLWLALVRALPGEVPSDARAAFESLTRVVPSPPVAPGSTPSPSVAPGSAPSSPVAPGSTPSSPVAPGVAVSPPPSSFSSPLRRLSMLRCAAAANLSRGVWDSDVLQHCDIADGQAGRLARLRALDGRRLDTHRERAAWVELAQSPEMRVRAAALDLVSRHPELRDVAARVAEPAPSGASASGGSAARVSEPAPSGASASGGSAARVAEPTPSGASASGASMAAEPPASGPDSLGVGVIRVEFTTDAGPLSLRVDPILAPIEAARLVALLRSGAYVGTSFYRVIPGVAAEFGDPAEGAPLRDAGDAGASGAPSAPGAQGAPVPFAPEDVGVGLPGPEGDSGRLFVTLARVPALDGRAAWLGHADGDWNAVVEGDLIRAVRVEP